MNLQSQKYGKSRVRVMKVIRDGQRHSIKELDVAVSLEGAFEEVYTNGDNASVVPTDTIKNTVNALSFEWLGEETEPFAEKLALHFLTKYPQVKRASIRTRERVWPRLSVCGEEHAHTFSQSMVAQPLVSAVAEAGKVTLESGIEDLLILKSAESGFEGYPRCEFTTLPETNDRILATSLTGWWQWQAEPESWLAANQRIIDSMMQPFANNYSPSVQATLFEMGSIALEACPEISRITLQMPNKHCNRIDLTPLGFENKNVLFVPVEEPHGAIEATITR